MGRLPERGGRDAEEEEAGCAEHDQDALHRGSPFAFVIRVCLRPQPLEMAGPSLVGLSRGPTVGRTGSAMGDCKVLGHDGSESYRSRCVVSVRQASMRPERGRLPWHVPRLSAGGWPGSTRTVPSFCRARKAHPLACPARRRVASARRSAALDGPPGPRGQRSTVREPFAIVSASPLRISQHRIRPRGFCISCGKRACSAMTSRKRPAPVLSEREPRVADLLRRA